MNTPKALRSTDDMWQRWDELHESDKPNADHAAALMVHIRTYHTADTELMGLAESFEQDWGGGYVAAHDAAKLRILETLVSCSDLQSVNAHLSRVN